MKELNLRSRNIENECTFEAVRASGPGGQHVNKTSTKVSLRFHIDNSYSFSIAEKLILTEKLATRITEEGFLIISSQTSRSQLSNKEDCITKLYTLLEKCLTPRKKRIPTKPSKSSIRENKEIKKRTSTKKANRKELKDFDEF